MGASMGGGAAKQGGVAPSEAGGALGRGVLLAVFDRVYRFALEEGGIAEDLVQVRQEAVVVEVDVQCADVRVLLLDQTGGSWNMHRLPCRGGLEFCSVLFDCDRGTIRVGEGEAVKLHRRDNMSFFDRIGRWWDVREKGSKR